MANNSDTGHGKNVAGFKTLTDIVVSIPAYNPSNTDIQTASLISKNAIVQTALNTVTQCRVANETAINARRSLFSAMRPLVLRIISILRSSRVSAERIDDAYHFKMKIYGERATAKKKLDPAAAPEEQPNYHSVAQLSFDARIEHFGNLLAVLEAEPLYKPNVEDLKLSALKAYHASLIASHDAANQSKMKLTKAISARTSVLYGPNTGVIDLVAAVKDEVIGMFSKRSPEYKLVNAVKFRRP